MSSYDEPLAFTAGAIGPPGARVFYLQVQREDGTTAVKLEKQQVLALAEYLAGLLNDLPPAADAPEAPDIVIVAEELVADDEDSGEVLRVAATRGQVQALIERAEELMLGGRPPCRLCGAPMDPAGHACPRAN